MKNKCRSHSSTKAKSTNDERNGRVIPFLKRSSLAPVKITLRLITFFGYFLCFKTKKVTTLQRNRLKRN